MTTDLRRAVRGPSSDVDPFSDRFLADPFPDLAALRAAGPAVWLPRYGVWAVARHGDVHAVLRDHARFSSAAGVGLANVAHENAWRRPSILLEVDPPLHTRNRAVVAGAMSPRALRSLQEVFDTQAALIADDLVARGRFDAVTDLAEVFPTVVFPKAFGVDGDARSHLLAYGAMVFNGHGPRNRLFEAAMAASDGVLEWIGAQCRREALRVGSIGADIYAAADAAGVSEPDAALLIRSFLSAGIDTTVSALSFGIRDFALYPDQWQAVRADPSLSRNAFEEVIRLESPVIGFFRTTTENVTIGDAGGAGGVTVEAVAGGVGGVTVEAAAGGVGGVTVEAAAGAGGVGGVVTVEAAAGAGGLGGVVTVEAAAGAGGLGGVVTVEAAAGGATIDAGAKVLVFYAGANRDPERWERPDDFDVRRRLVGHLGYGIGPHACVGMVIARMEGEAVFRALASRVAAWHLDGPVRPRLNNTLRGLDSLPVRVIPV